MYYLETTPEGARSLDRLPQKVRLAVAETISGPLAENPQRLGKPLVGQLEGLRVARRGDYRQAVGVIEAKPVGWTLTGVEPQTLGYRESYPDELPASDVGGTLPFGYESTGVETRFTCGLDPVPTSRRVFSFQ